MINSYPNYTFIYGYFEERAQLPYGQGLWPAFWLYGTSGGAEIDVMEMYGSQSLGTMTTVYQTVQNCSGCQEVYTGINPTTGYHRYGAQWTPSQVVFFIDGTRTASFSYASSIPMYIITNLSVAGPAWGANYQPTASEFPAAMDVSNINAYNPNGTCQGSLPAGTNPLPAGNICVNRTNYVPAIPPTDNFTSLNRYNARHPGGTWQTKFWWRARTNNGLYGAVYYGEDRDKRPKRSPFKTGSSGLTITAKLAPDTISGYRAAPLAVGSDGALKTLGIRQEICSSCGSNYLESGYAPVSGSFSLTCYVSVPKIVSGYPLLLATGNPMWTNNKGFEVNSDPSGDLYFNIGYGTGTSVATLSGLAFATPQSLTLTYNKATRSATIYVGHTSSPASASVTLPSPYVASGSPVYFNAGMYDFYQGGTFDDCAEWDGTVLTAADVDSIASATL
jgi:hypothetical protein